MNHLFNLSKQRNSVLLERYVVHFYTRCEFQQRGSPNWHSLLWLRNDPKYEAGENNDIVFSFIDNFISADLNHDDELIDLQMHKHTFTCRKGKNKGRCLFDIPFFPLNRTMILLSLNEVSIKHVKPLRKKRGREDIQEDNAISFIDNFI